MDALAHCALIALGGVDHAPVSHLAVDEHGVGADLAVLADDRLPPENGPRQDGGARPDGDPGVDVGVVRVQHVHPGGQMEGGDILLHRLLQADELLHRAEGEHHAAHRQHGLADLLDPAAVGELLHVPLIGVLRPHRGHRALREAGRHLVMVLRRADNKKPPDAFFHPCPHTPVQYGAKQHVLQHQRLSIIGLSDVIRQKNHNTFHRSSPLSCVCSAQSFSDQLLLNFIISDISGYARGFCKKRHQILHRAPPPPSPQGLFAQGGILMYTKICGFLSPLFRRVPIL